MDLFFVIVWNTTQEQKRPEVAQFAGSSRLFLEHKLHRTLPLMGGSTVDLKPPLTLDFVQILVFLVLPQHYSLEFFENEAFRRDVLQGLHSVT
jgi:hypothetical protein